MAAHFCIPGESRRDPELSREAPPDLRISDADIESAKLELVGDLDTFQEWLGGELCFISAISSEWEMRRPERLAAAEVSTQMHAALVATLREDKDTLLAAMKPLLEAYFRAKDKRLMQMASEVEA